MPGKVNLKESGSSVMKEQSIKVCDDSRKPEGLLQVPQDLSGKRTSVFARVFVGWEGEASPRSTPSKADAVFIGHRVIKLALRFN